MVQGSPSLQTSTDPLQLPPLQTSALVQPMPSSQGKPSCWTFQAHFPVDGSQLPQLQVGPPSQSLGEPGLHLPSLQASAPVHLLPSVQGAPSSFLCRQLPVLASQLSMVQPLASSQFFFAPG